MAFKFITKDSNLRNKFSASSKGFHPGINKSASISTRYASSITADLPLSKSAQMQGGGGGMANVMWGQPMFFSPLHTPQNWQIASKRREVYQWDLISPCDIMTCDYTYKDISELDFAVGSVVEDVVTGGEIFEDIDCIPIMSSEGNFVKPPRFSQRDCVNKRHFSFKATGYWRNLKISEEHQIFILDGEWYKKKLKVQSNAKYRRKIGISPNGIQKVKIPDKLIKKIPACKVNKKDYLITPIPNVGSKSLNENLAWLVGFCVADGYCYTNEKTYQVGFTGSEGEQALLKCEELLKANFEGTISSHQHGIGKGWRITASTKKVHNFFRTYIANKSVQKKFTKELFSLDKESRLNIIAGYLDGDGSLNKHGKLVANCYSKDLADQIYWLLLSCNVVCSLDRLPLYGEHYDTSSEWCYRIVVPSSETSKIARYLRGNKIPKDFNPKPQRDLRFFYEEDGIKYLAQPIDKMEEFLFTGKGYDIEMTNDRHAFVASGYVCSNCRFFYENEPKVAAGIDFYSQFPMNGFKLSCKNKKIMKFYEKMIKRIKLDHWLRLISFEYHLFGDVFPFVEFECAACHNTGMKPNGAPCNHPGGDIKRIVVMNPDWIMVHSSPLASDPVFTLEPDDELKGIIAEKKPAEIYNRLPKSLINAIMTSQPIQLANRCISHIKHQGSPYGAFGVSMIRRLFTYLAYKMKLMTANWIVAERLILPIRVVKIGDKDRPASQADISDVSTQLTYVANDPNLTLVTHHAFEMDYVGATGKIHNITQELEQIGKEILDGLMLNQAILSGEMGSYSSAQVGIEILIRRLDNWRNILSEWVENHIFLPVAMMQGFIDEEKSEDSDEKEYLYPTIEWNDMQLRDKSSERQSYMQLHDKGVISTQTLLEKFDLDWDKEIQRKREEQVMASATGMVLGPPQGGAGGAGGGMGGLDLGGLGGGGGGGMPPGGDMGAGGAPGGMPPGAAPGGEAGGMGASPAGGSPGGAGTVAAAQQVSPMPNFIGKRGEKRKADEQQEAQPMQTKVIELTKLEQKLLRTLTGMSGKIPYKLFGQYQVKLPNQPQPFVMDFAYPAIGVAVEADGEKWHEEIDSKIRDQQRDQKLANVGWRILRFKEEAINNNIDDVARIIYSNVIEAAKDHAQRNKQADSNPEIKKIAEQIKNIETLDKDILKYDRIDIPGDLGYIYLIGI